MQAWLDYSGAEHDIQISLVNARNIALCILYIMNILLFNMVYPKCIIPEKDLEESLGVVK